MGSPETFRALLAANALPKRTDFALRTKNLCDNVNEFLYKSAHEPSLAGHRIQEHVYKTVPTIEKERTNAQKSTHELNGVMFDLAYSSDFLNKLDESIQNSAETREIVSDLASKISSCRAGNQANR